MTKSFDALGLCGEASQRTAGYVKTGGSLTIQLGVERRGYLERT